MNYPNNIKKTKNTSPLPSPLGHANRGMELEDMINQTNAYYKEKDIAIIYKKPTPIGTVKVSYLNNKKVIDKAYFETQSTLDYNGIYKGRYIDFDAKCTANRTSFPLSNIHAHQVKHIRSIIKHGGIAFLIISINNNIYLLPGEKLTEFIDNNSRKSLPYNFIETNAHIIPIGYRPRCDYIKIVEEVYFKGGNL